MSAKTEALLQGKYRLRKCSGTSNDGNGSEKLLAKCIYVMALPRACVLIPLTIRSSRLAIKEALAINS